MSNKMFSTKQIVFGVIGILLAILFYVLTPFENLSVEGMHALGFFLMAVMWWIGGTFPDYVTCFWMLACMIVFKVVPLGTAFAAWSGSVIWIVVPIFAIGAALSKTGLLRRVVLWILSKFPGSYNSQILGFLIAGNIVNPLIPSATAKVAIAAPLANTYNHEMGFENNTKPAAGFFSAAWMGFGANGPMWLTGTTMTFTMTGLLDAEYQGITFLDWIKIAWPWGIVLLVLSYIAIRIFYAPKDAKPLSKEYMKQQYMDLGAMSKEEKITAVILILCLVLWVLERTIGIAAAVTAILGMSALLSLKVIDRNDFRSKIAWESIVFIATSTSLATVFSTVGITTWVSESYGTYVAPLFSNMFILCIVSIVIVTVMRLIFVSQTALMTIFTVACAPFAVQAGINPFIPGFLALVAVNCFNMKYQNATLLTALAASGQMVEFKQISKMSFVYSVACIIGVLCCIPMWMLAGMC